MLSSYAASVNRQVVPYPQPVYQEVEHVEPPQSSSAVAASDFQLLRLAADDLDVQYSSAGLAELLRPAGIFSPSAAFWATHSSCMCSHTYLLVRIRSLVRNEQSIELFKAQWVLGMSRTWCTADRSLCRIAST